MDILPPHSLRPMRWQAEPRVGPREVLSALIAVGLFVWTILRVIQF
jgi:hypothetical protein